MKRAASRSLHTLCAKREMDIEDIHNIQIDRIREMRSAGGAPVDTMGCHMLADPSAEPKDRRFQVLLSLMLSSQTKDHITAAAMQRLKDYGCSTGKMLEMKRNDLEQMLCPVGFYKRKAEYIQRATQILVDQHKGDVPDTFSGLCDLPGVGPKMAHLVLQVAWNKCEGIAVDTHVHRIVNRLGWMTTKTPEATREQLQSILPKQEWKSINHLLVGFGQTVCLPVKPKCAECLCHNICPSSTSKSGAIKVELDTNKTEVVDGIQTGKKAMKNSKVKVEINVKDETRDSKQNDYKEAPFKSETESVASKTDVETSVDVNSEERDVYVRRLRSRQICARK